MGMMKTGFCPCGSGLPATKRCRACSKPVCEKCLIERGGEVYCGQDCYQTSVRYSRMTDTVGKARRRKPISLGRLLLHALSYLIIGYLIWRLVLGGDAPNEWIRKVFF